MANTQAKEVLTGSDAKVFLNGEELGTWTNLEATVTINYENVQIGYDVDRKPVSWTGEGSISWQVTNSMTAKLFNQIRLNKDARFTIEAEITKTATGETQSETLSGVTFDSLPLSPWAKGELVANELSFRFIPSSSVFPQIID